jgi:hypothetical protein
MEKVNYRGDPAFFKTPGTTANTDVTRDESRLGISTKDECQIVTPGTWITGTGNKVLGMDLDRLGAADEINEIVGALANFVISKVMEKGMAMVRGDDLSPNNSNWRAGIASLQAQQNADMAAGSASAKSGSSYTPNYYSYTNLASPEVINARTNILNTISVILTSEQAYYDAYNYIYSAADLMKEKFLGVINCYQGKISYNNPPLTNSELNTANNQISTASII